MTRNNACLPRTDGGSRPLNHREGGLPVNRFGRWRQMGPPTPSTLMRRYNHAACRGRAPRRAGDVPFSSSPRYEGGRPRRAVPLAVLSVATAGTGVGLAGPPRGLTGLNEFRRRPGVSGLRTAGAASGNQRLRTQTLFACCDCSGVDSIRSELAPTASGLGRDTPFSPRAQANLAQNGSLSYC